MDFISIAFYFGLLENQLLGDFGGVYRLLK